MRRVVFPLTLLGLAISLQILRAQANSPKVGQTFEQRLSKRLNDDIQKALEPLHMSHVQDDSIEKKLIETLFGVDRLRLWPVSENAHETLSVTVIKPGKRLGVVRSFKVANKGNTFQFRYRCLSAAIDNATAVIAFTGIEDNQLQKLERVLYFDQDLQEGKRLPD